MKKYFRICVETNDYLIINNLKYVSKYSFFKIHNFLLEVVVAGNNSLRSYIFQSILYFFFLFSFELKVLYSENKDLILYFWYLNNIIFGYVYDLYSLYIFISFDYTHLTIMIFSTHLFYYFRKMLKLLYVGLVVVLDSLSLCF